MMTDAEYLSRIKRIADEAQRGERRAERLENVLRAMPNAVSFDDPESRERLAKLWRYQLKNAQTLCDDVGVCEAATYLAQCGWPANVSLYVLSGSEVFR